MVFKKRLYETFEWNNLHPLIRADIITVAQGSRQGANIELFKLERQSVSYFLEQKNCLDKWLKYTGFEYTNEGNNYFISSNEGLLEKLLDKQIKAGEFLGYPQCCIKNFEQGCEKYLQGNGKGPAVDFWLNAKKEKDKDKLEPVLEYALHVPCTTICTDSIEFTYLQKQAIEYCEPETAEALRSYNLEIMKRFEKNH